MQPHEKLLFFEDFFDFTYPIPLKSRFSQQELRNNDMKISLEIATRSNLRMQSEPKSGLVSFSCKNYGKNCFQIFAFKEKDYYVVETDYSKISHRRNCELKNECFQYLKIYNLMKLKKNLIESVMVKLNLFNSSPSEILGKMSNEMEYFFQKNINYNLQMRRKLRKRFDNIINIDIKKITKGGREEIHEEGQGQRQVLKQRRRQENEGNLQEGSQQQEQEFDETSFFERGNSRNVIKKHKVVKKKERSNKKGNKREKFHKGGQVSRNNYNKENEHAKKRSQVSEGMRQQLKLQQSLYDDQIYEQQQDFICQDKYNHNQTCKQQNYGICQQKDQIYQQQKYDHMYNNPGSLCQLKQIKQLNQQFNGFDDIFAWSLGNKQEDLKNYSENHYHDHYDYHTQVQTINDKLKEGVFLSLRNSLLRKHRQGQSLQHMTFPENFPSVNDHDDSLANISGC